jgi:hypothetical protein
VTFAFSPYLLAPITRDHQMLKSPHSLDPLASWVTCVLLCASCPPNVGLTNHTWCAAFHMFASCPTHVHSLTSPFPHGRLPCHTMAVLIHQSSLLRWVCVENSSKRALKSSTRTPGSEDKKTPEGLWRRRRDWRSHRRRTKPWVSDKSTLTSLE